MRQIISMFCVIVAAATFSTQASAATLNGDTVQLDYVGGFGPTFPPQTFQIDAGVDYSIDLTSDRFFDIDVSKDIIGIEYRGTIGVALDTTGYQVQLTGLDFGTGIASIVANFTEAPGSFPKDLGDIITFSSSSISVNFRGTWENGDRLAMMLVPQTSPVPLPAGLPLLLGGIAVFGLLCRRNMARAL